MGQPGGLVPVPRAALARVVVGAGGEQSDHGLGVPDIDGEQHSVVPFSVVDVIADRSGRSRINPTGRSIDVEAEVEHRRRMGESPDRDEVSPGRGQRRRGRRGRRLPDTSTRMPPPGRVRHGRHRPPPRRRTCCRASRRWHRPPRPRRPVRAGRTRPRPSGRATGAGRRTRPRRWTSPARWLSLTRTASESPPRWLWPPPARTAAFSRARSPGVVLRVSSIRVDGLAGGHRLHVATGERGHARTGGRGS